MNHSPWRSLESIPGFSALPAVWRRHLGDDFETFRAAFLQKKPTTVKSFPCPRNCGCAHCIIGDTAPNSQSPITAVCRCEPSLCPPLTLTLAEVTPLHLNWAKLGRAICKAFGLDAGDNDFPIPNTRQIGSWSSEAVPVILTIQTERHLFRRVISELALRLQKPFILFAPTSDHLDAACHELLGLARAGFFALDGHVRLTLQGAFYPAKTPGAIFAHFTPPPKESLAEDTTRKAFALVKALDANKSMKLPSPAAVFSFYCMQGLSITDMARKLHCSRGTILNRLDFIRKKTGIEPGRIRILSSQFEAIEDQAADSRASHLHRKGLIDDAAGDDEDEDHE